MGGEVGAFPLTRSLELSREVEQKPALGRTSSGTFFKAEYLNNYQAGLNRLVDSSTITHETQQTAEIAKDLSRSQPTKLTRSLSDSHIGKDVSNSPIHARRASLRSANAGNKALHNKVPESESQFLITPEEIGEIAQGTLTENTLNNQENSEDKTSPLRPRSTVVISRDTREKRSSAVTAESAPFAIQGQISPSISRTALSNSDPLALSNEINSFPSKSSSKSSGLKNVRDKDTSTKPTSFEIQGRNFTVTADKTTTLASGANAKVFLLKESANKSGELSKTYVLKVADITESNDPTPALKKAVQPKTPQEMDLNRNHFVLNRLHEKVNKEPVKKSGFMRFLPLRSKKTTTNNIVKKPKVVIYLNKEAQKQVLDAHNRADKEGKEITLGNRGIIEHMYEGTLSKFIDIPIEKEGQKGRTEKQRTIIAGDLFNGMNTIYEHGLIHLDIKPGNILIEKEKNKETGKRTGEYRAYFCDFGGAYFKEELTDEAQKARGNVKLGSGEISNTSAYMSEEDSYNIFDNKGLNYDQKMKAFGNCMAFSFGLLLFELYSKKGTKTETPVPYVVTDGEKKYPSTCGINEPCIGITKARITINDKRRFFKNEPGKDPVITFDDKALDPNMPEEMKLIIKGLLKAPDERLSFEEAKIAFDNYRKGGAQ